jgi:predicted ATP-binding protein involved in virulence
MDFRRGINLLIGDNSVGKTSLLRACNLVMNAFFCGYSDENTKWKSAEDDDFREIKNDDVATDELPINIAFELDEIDCPVITLEDGSVKHLYDNEPLLGESEYPTLYIEKRSKKNARNLVSGLLPLRNYASLLQKNSHSIIDGTAVQRNALPLFAYFTTEDIHTVRKFDKEKRSFKKYPQKPSFGYFENFDCKGLLDCWLKRLLVLKEAKKGEQEIECVRKAVVSALGPNGCSIINDMKVRDNDNEVYFIFCDGREVRSDLLSDGYRRLVSIVIDLAFRCALLNKVMYGDEAYKQTHGTAIIDEIDEHLHPALQVRILKALHNTFPKIQFIVSTHAPLVMSSVENTPENVVYKLEYNDGIYSHKELNTYGLDSNLILEEKVGVLCRVPLIDSKMKEILDLISKRELGKASTMISELETITDPTQPELVKLRAILNRIEAIGV